LTQTALPFSDKTWIQITDDGGARTVLVEELCRHLGVDALVRLRSTDFALLSEVSGQFVHFNLEATLNEVGRRYAILPIVQPGSRLADGREVLPIVDPRRLRRATCVEVVQRIPTDRVTDDQFAHSLPTIRTTGELEAALVERYAPMFPSLTEKELLARGCAVTRLVLEDQ
jgi:hypothetical protein